jgi:hypothetical protein
VLGDITIDVPAALRLALISLKVKPLPANPRKPTRLTNLTEMKTGSKPLETEIRRNRAQP